MKYGFVNRIFALTPLVTGLILTGLILAGAATPVRAQVSFLLESPLPSAYPGNPFSLTGRVLTTEAGWSLVSGSANVFGPVSGASDVLFGPVPLLEDLGIGYDSGAFSVLSVQVSSSAVPGDPVGGDITFDFENVTTGETLSVGQNFSLTVLAAPEPGSAALLLPGLIAIAGVVLRRKPLPEAPPQR